MGIIYVMKCVAYQCAVSVARARSSEVAAWSSLRRRAECVFIEISEARASLVFTRG